MPLPARLLTLLRHRTLDLPSPDLTAPCPDAAVPAADAPEPPPRPGTLLADAVAQLLVIDYRDAEGQESRRRISVRRVWDDPDRAGETVVEAFCHERQAPRWFRSARIRTVTDPATGQAFTDADWFLKRHLAAVPASALRRDHTARAIARCRAELALLACLAGRNGRVAAADREPILVHVAGRCSDLAYNKPRLLGYLGRLHPDADALQRALTWLLVLPEADLQRLLRTAVALLEAEGAADPAEAALLAELQRAVSGQELQPA